MFTRKAPSSKVTRESSLAMRPLKLVDAEMDIDAAGNGKLRVPLAPPRFAKWLAPKFEGRLKTYEFDAVGVFVWHAIDGKTSVERLIRRVASEYKLDLRQSEAATTAFLKTLMQRGLIGMPVTKESAREPT